MKKIIQLLALTIALFVGAISCKKDSFNINTNPNQATDSTIVYNVILPAALNNTGRVVARNWGWLQNYLGYWARSGTYAPNTSEETYELTTSFQTQIWNNIYDNLYDYQVMQGSAQKAGARFYEGVARIMKAHNYALLVDIYNDVPYSEALKGAGNTTPKYDKGIDIYRDLLRQIDTGIALIKSTNTDITMEPTEKTLATDDIMFAGDQTLWAQFGNTVKLRLLTHMMNGGIPSNADGTIGSAASYAIPQSDMATEFDSIAVEGDGFLLGDASVQPGYAADKGNPFFNLYVTDNAGGATQNSVYYKANSYAIGYYTYNADPRITRFYVAGGLGLVGVAYGLPSETTNAAANLAGIGPGVAKTASAPQWIITAAESYFMQAECMNRGFIAGDAGATMRQGIAESVLSLGAAAGSDIQYESTNAGYADVDYDAVENTTDPNAPFNLINGGLYTIISQKWFALNAIAPYEVWSDYRRVDFAPGTNHFVYGVVTGYDAGPPISVSPANSQTEIPVRLLYPQTEYQYNPTNVGNEPAVGAYPFSHIFWDLN